MALELTSVERKMALATFLLFSDTCGCMYHSNCQHYGGNKANRKRVHRSNDCSADLQVEIINSFVEKKFSVGKGGTKDALRKFFAENCSNIREVSYEESAKQKEATEYLRGEVDRLQKDVVTTLKSFKAESMKKNNDIETQLNQVRKQMINMNKLTQSGMVTAETLEQVQKENNQLMNEKEDLAAKYERALTTARSKSVQLDTVTREISQLKEELKSVREVPADVVVDKEKQLFDAAWHSGDEALLQTEWNNFRAKFNGLHNELTDLLQKSILARDATVLSNNLKNVGELTKVAESVREEFLKVTLHCNEEIEDVLDRILPSASSTSNAETEQTDAKFLE